MERNGFKCVARRSDAGSLGQPLLLAGIDAIGY
jgi:hypothetical protein